MRKVTSPIRQTKTSRCGYPRKARSSQKNCSRSFSPLSSGSGTKATGPGATAGTSSNLTRSEEHTSELQSRLHLVCRLLLEKKKNKNEQHNNQITTRAVKRELHARQTDERRMS